MILPLIRQIALSTIVILIICDLSLGDSAIEGTFSEIPSGVAQGWPGDDTILDEHLFDEDSDVGRDGAPGSTFERSTVIMDQLLHGYADGEWVDQYTDLSGQPFLFDDFETLLERAFKDDFQQQTAGRANSNSVEEYPPSTLSVQGEQSNLKFQVSPRSLDFGHVHVHEYTERSFTVRNTESSPIAVQIHAPAPHRVISEASFTLAPESSRTVTLRFQPISAGLYLGNVVIHSGVGVASVGIRGRARLLTRERDVIGSHS